tara:strand:+ start:216 stop:683 length:468 start_codon:yes stop_codon:yes gene_type:complete
MKKIFIILSLFLIESCSEVKENDEDSIEKDVKPETDVEPILPYVYLKCEEITLGRGELVARYALLIRLIPDESVDILSERNDGFKWVSADWLNITLDEYSFESTLYRYRLDRSSLMLWLSRFDNYHSADCLETSEEKIEEEIQEIISYKRSRQKI